MAKAPAQRQDYDPEERPSFSSILDMPASQAVRPKPIPVGTYLAMILGHPDYGKSTKKGTGYARFTLKLLEASDDVDQEALKAALTKADGTVQALSERTVSVTHWDTPNAAYRLREFLNNLGIEDDDSAGGLGNMIQQVPGRQCWIHIRHKASEDGEGLYAEVDRTIPVE